MQFEDASWVDAGWDTDCIADCSAKFGISQDKMISNIYSVDQDAKCKGASCRSASCRVF